jgi:hypothetical protein
MDARLNHGGAPQFPATESDLDPEMVAIAGAIIRQRIGKFEYPLFEVYLSANHRGARILRRPWASLLTPSNLTLHKSLDAPRCWRETCRGYKYPVELAARRGSDETFA